ncbi:hypothetical protein TNCV_4889841 [Trichonephila clavipes]|nr:hypothetical protein TNCV_4889841 [Trichonephila clavipes]
MYTHKVQFISTGNGRRGGLEVACPHRKLEIEDSIPVGVDKFSECENRRHVGQKYQEYRGYQVFQNNVENRQLPEITGMPPIPGMAETSRMNQILRMPPIPEESGKKETTV